jgi:hypothetical protein
MQENDKEGEISFFDQFTKSASEFFGSFFPEEQVKKQEKVAETLVFPFLDRKRWKLLNEQLGNRISSVSELSQVLKTNKPNLYPEVIPNWSLVGFGNLIEEDGIDFFGTLCPFMQNLALILVSLFDKNQLPQYLISKEASGLGGHYSNNSQDSLVRLTKFQV